MLVDKFTMFFASAEINYRAIKDTPTKNWLVSFYYLKGKSHQDIEDFLYDAKYGLKRLGINEERTLFLDSGAFSFQNAAGFIKGRSNQDKSGLSTNDLLIYAHEFFDFIRVYGHWFDIIAEIDVDYIIGIHKTKYLRELLWRTHDEVLRKNILSVWHIPRGEKRWIEHLQDRDYVCIEGHSRHQDDPISFYNQFLAPAHDKGVKVHGFAFTHLGILERVPFDSVDSASWMLQAANGTVKTPWGTVAISANQLQAELGNLLHWNTLQGRDKRIIESYIRSCGFTPQQLIEHWLPRAALNCHYYMWLEDRINKIWSKEALTQKVYQKSLFDLVGQKYKSTDPDEILEFNK